MVTGTANAVQISHFDLAAVTSRADLALERSEAALVHAAQLVEESRELRGVGDETPWPRYFVVHGYVEGCRVRASWFRGLLRASPILRVRCLLLVSMGETFCVEGGTPAIPAGLDDPLGAMLTLIRACDQIDTVSLGPLGAERSVLRYRSS